MNLNVNKVIIILNIILLFFRSSTFAQFDNSGISAGFFDSSDDKTINFSNFHLPPLTVLFENAKETPQIQSLVKSQKIAEMEVGRTKRKPLDWINASASYGYGRGDVFGNSSSTLNTMIYQYQASVHSNWGLGVSAGVSLGELFSYKSDVRSQRLTAEQAKDATDQAYDNLKLQIALLFVTINNNLVLLKTASENAAMYQGAGALKKQDFESGSMDIGAYAETKSRETGAVGTFQSLQTQIISDILTLEILTHTPIITNSTTDISLSSAVHMNEKQLKRENKAVAKKIKQEAEEEQKLEKRHEKELKKSVKAKEKVSKKNRKTEVTKN